jgi:hypothetical protein
MDLVMELVVAMVLENAKVTVNNMGKVMVSVMDNVMVN